MLKIQEFFHALSTLQEKFLKRNFLECGARRVLQHSTLQYDCSQLWKIQVKTGFAQYIEGRMFDATWSW